MVVVWFKRDLRLTDHEPLVNALLTGRKILLLYSFEPLWVNDPHYSEFHLDFIKESLVDMQRQLESLQTRVLVVQEDILPVFNRLNELEPIEQLFSHQETGMLLTYERDKAVSQWCRQHGVRWTESVSNGVFRGIKTRKKWKNDWVAFINQKITAPIISENDFFSIAEIKARFQPHFNQVDLTTSLSAKRQKGGTSQALKYLESFVTKRIEGYNAHYSKPATSRLYSSRLSPYLAWGNLSTRQVCQYVTSKKNQIKDKRDLSAFLSRMRWQAHFIQKFEMEGTMEFHSINSGYHVLDKKMSPELQKAWKEGKTGIPMVDAAMRCLVTTGFVNFRLRALLASFFTHLLWQPWQDCTEHLAQHFLDFEPGIHFPQLNMQSGETGINTIRIYNPVKNGKDHDPRGVFIKKWVPELANLPLKYLHEPWKIPPMELQFLHFSLGKDYPYPIVDIEKMWAFASETLWLLRKQSKVKHEGRRILEKHTLPGRPVWDRWEF
ncbi:deoxyribodipyrimidine photolyase [Flavobacteriaceae bacterium TP-CH-4]|uniref:Deoxyribodipyrimidine photolyase n=1 Tax=Pelagihabitans pacificus TaxID=2696054 RepID=A0A967E692_9FLAO|nr:FAD-binding domain-containing protein [Pelagihabitans pacificus]NHF60257.1 deoxyribodipyrimidine photolyase [Pelagihabitans pacificus]